MQLPVIVDIAIGLLFVYLILSLLASELQELIATLLQWRAQHLKRSVEMMLAGGSEPKLEGMNQDEVAADVQRAKELADRVYNNPLINTLNYEAAGLLAQFFRRIFNGVYTFFRFNTNIFGDRSGGPSYIPSTTFADALTSTLRIPDMVRLVSGKRLSIFSRNVVVGVRHILQPHLSDPVVAQAIDRFSKRLGLILTDYRNEKFDLLGSVVRLERTTDQFIETLQVRSPQISVEELELYRNEIFQQDDQQHYCKRAAPGDQIGPAALPGLVSRASCHLIRGTPVASCSHSASIAANAPLSFRAASASSTQALRAEPSGISAPNWSGFSAAAGSNWPSTAPLSSSTAEVNSAGGRAISAASIWPALMAAVTLALSS